LAITHGIIAVLGFVLLVWFAIGTNTPA
jgi:hypothetical protein